MFWIDFYTALWVALTGQTLRAHIDYQQRLDRERLEGTR